MSEYIYHIQIEELKRNCERIITCTLKEEIITFGTRDLTDKQREWLSKAIGSVRSLKQELKKNKGKIIERTLPRNTLKGGYLAALIGNKPKRFRKTNIRYILNTDKKVNTKRRIDKLFIDNGWIS